MLLQRPHDQLISWMSDSSEPQNPVVVSPVEIRKARPSGVTHEEWDQTLFDRTIESVQNALNQGRVVIASLAADARDKTYSIVGAGRKLDSYVHSLSVERVIALTLSNLSVKRVHISQPGVRLVLRNCNVAELNIPHGISSTNVITLDTTIGTLRIGYNAIEHLEMQGGSLLNVVCPPPGGENPFTGTVSFKNVFFPRKRGLYVLQGPQPYRNLRHHLRSLENAQMANLVHSAELAVEREDDSWTNKVLSHLYEWMSDFGSSALRPFLWLGLLFSVSVLLILRSDGAALAFSDASSNLVGWQTLLVDPSCGDHARAFYLALQPIVNPIGIFGPRSLLVPRHPWLAVWLSVHGVLAVVLLALLIFAIRRRFKIQQ